MKVLGISPYPLAGPSPRYRLYNFREKLKEEGIDLDIKSFLTSQAFELRMNGSKIHPLAMLRVIIAIIERIHQARTANRRYDLIYIHRQTAPFKHRNFDNLFLRSGVPLIFDMDDAVYTSYPIDHLLRACAAVTVGNQYLATYVKQIAPQVPVTIIPTTVDTEQYTVRPKRKDGDPLVVGWIGTASTFHRYLLPVLPGLIQTTKAGGAEFRVIASSDVRHKVEELGGHFIQWDLATEVSELQEFDIGLMPLHDDNYVRGKCAFKLIQYGAIGIPSIGTDIGANKEVIVNGISGFLTSTVQEMQHRLTELIETEHIRRTMGQAARKIIEEKFSLRSQIPVMEQVFKDALNLQKIHKSQ
ncbi:glycosyltransferase family 4 protein [Deinococcus sp. D7000]|nr:glycosyltransferase family 4 protein [Deinococcus sp. D7000]